jgi:DNA-binding transcriptional regulator YiaG
MPIKKLKVCNLLTLAHGHAQIGGAERKRLRQKKGRIQQQFAEVSGTRQQYISSLECGRRNRQ